MANTKVPSELIADNSVGIDALNVTDGTNGQYLQTDGAGTLSFSTVSAPAFKTFGTDSIMIGDTTTGTIDAANYNVGLGVDVFAALTSADNNVAVGFAAGAALTTGNNNTFVGANAGDANTSGFSNSGIGKHALGATTTGTKNSALGHGALSANTTASNNIAVGWSALTANTTGSLNVAVGNSALGSNTTAPYNTAIGYQALRDNVTGNQNTAVGYEALASNTALKNTAVGAYAQYQSTTAQESTALGYGALAALTTGSYNVAVGAGALDAMTTVSSNTAVGYNAGGAVTTGSLNTFIGSLAGDNTTTGVGNLAIGYAMRTSATGVVRGHIGYNNGDTGTADYAITFGRSGTDWSRLSYGASSFTTGSDERKKKDIADHPLGLDFIKQLRTVNYHFKAPCDVPEEWDTHKASETEAKITTWQTGMLAQDVKAALDNLGVDPEKFNGWGQEPDGMQTLDYGQFVMPLIKALQEADAKIEALTTRIEALEG